MKPITKKLYAFGLVASLMFATGFMFVSENVFAYNNPSFQDLDNITADVSDLVINNMGAVLTILVVIALIGIGVYAYKKIKKAFK